MNDVSVFVIKKEKSIQQLDDFLYSYIGNFVPMSDYFEYPMSYNEETVFESSSYIEMLNYIIINNLDFLFYFKGVEDPTQKAFVCYYKHIDIVVYGVMVFIDNLKLKEEVNEIDWFKGNKKYVWYYDHSPTLQEVKMLLDSEIQFDVPTLE